MADTEITNITPLRPSPAMGEGPGFDRFSRKAKDPTAALRAKRYRGKRKIQPAVKAPVPLAEIPLVEKPSDIKAAVTVAHPTGRAADVMAYTAAIALASVAALLSVRGMVQLFPGTPLLIIAMASMMEASKLVTAGWLARRWRVTAWFWRLTLVALVAGLAVINATGVYAQLVAAHVGERGAAQAAVETQDAALAARIELTAGKVADLDRRLGQIDQAVEGAAKRGRTNTALSAMEGQRRARAGLAGERNEAAGTLQPSRRNAPP